jgi:hypothetical protein
MEEVSTLFEGVRLLSDEEVDVLGRAEVECVDEHVVGRTLVNLGSVRMRAFRADPYLAAYRA